jgi:hypothetical protein
MRTKNRPKFHKLNQKYHNHSHSHLTKATNQHGRKLQQNLVENLEILHQTLQETCTNLQKLIINKEG